MLLIELLSASLHAAECTTLNAADDADTLIVDVAIDKAKHKPTIVVTDTDVLVLLLHHTPTDTINCNL